VQLIRICTSASHTAQIYTKYVRVSLCSLPYFSRLQVRARASELRGSLFEVVRALTEAPHLLQWESVLKKFSTINLQVCWLKCFRLSLEHGHKHTHIHTQTHAHNHTYTHRYTHAHAHKNTQMMALREQLRAILRQVVVHPKMVTDPMLAQGERMCLRVSDKG